MIEPLSFLTVVDSDDVTVALLALDTRRDFPDDATADEINGLLFRRGLRRCPHSGHDEFATCWKIACKGVVTNSVY